VAVDIGTARGESKAGRERKKRTKRESSSVGRSPYSRTRRWLRRRKWWAARQRPRCRGHGQGGGGHYLKRLARSRRGRPVVWTGWLTGGPRWFLYYPQIIQTGSNLEIEKEGINMLHKFPNFACC
jgi:hypothetical protein